MNGECRSCGVLPCRSDGVGLNQYLLRPDIGSDIDKFVGTPPR